MQDERCMMIMRLWQFMQGPVGWGTVDHVKEIISRKRQNVLSRVTVNYLIYETIDE